MGIKRTNTGQWSTFCDAATLVKCQQIGRELKTSMQEGLEDNVSSAVHRDTARGTPFDEFVDLGQGMSCPIYVSVSECVAPGELRRPPAGAPRGGGGNAWRYGVDRNYIFNFRRHSGFTSRQPR